MTPSRWCAWPARGARAPPLALRPGTPRPARRPPETSSTPSPASSGRSRTATASSSSSSWWGTARLTPGRPHWSAPPGRRPSTRSSGRAAPRWPCTSRSSRTPCRCSCATRGQIRPGAGARRPSGDRQLHRRADGARRRHVAVAQHAGGGHRGGAGPAPRAVAAVTDPAAVRVLRGRRPHARAVRHPGRAGRRRGRRRRGRRGRPPRSS